MGLPCQCPTAPFRPAQIREMRTNRQNGLAPHDGLLRVWLMDQQANARVAKLDEELPERSRRPRYDGKRPKGHCFDASGPDREHDRHQPLSRLPGASVTRRHVAEDPNRLKSEFSGEIAKIDFLLRSRSRKPGGIANVDCQSLHFLEEQQDRQNVNQFLSNLQAKKRPVAVWPSTSPAEDF
jgi:hypothetical protein